MDIRALDYYVAVASLLNFSKAAESRFVAQSTLSKTVADLEAELGVKLLERSNRSVKLTPAGADFLIKAQKILEDVSRLEASAKSGELGSDKSFMSRSLKIGVSGQTCDNCAMRSKIVDAILRLRSDNPQAKIEIEEFSVDDLPKALRNRQVDVAFLAVNEMSDSSLNYLHIMSERLILVFSDRIPVPESRDELLKMIQEYPLYILSQDTFGLPHIMSVLNDFGASPNIEFSPSKNVPMLLSELGDGILIILESDPSIRLSDHLNIFYELGEKAVMKYCLMWKKSNINSLIQDFAECFE